MTAPTPAPIAGPEPGSGAPTPLAMLRGLSLDVGLPVVAYYALHLLGATDWVALLAASAVAAARLVWCAVRDRALNAFATVMLLVYGVGLALVFTTDDPRALLLRTSFVTAAVGLVFLITAWDGRRPLTLAATQAFSPAAAAGADAHFAASAAVRRGHRISSAVWGAGLLADAVLRIPVVYLLPIDVAVGVSEALFVATMVGLAVWNGWYVRRSIARARRGM
jgi:hypothetical protein